MDKFIKITTFLITCGAVLIAAENHYAKASDLQSKADASSVAQLQKELLRDRKDEVEYEIFILEKQEELSELDAYRLKKLYSRLEELKEALE